MFIYKSIFILTTDTAAMISVPVRKGQQKKNVSSWGILVLVILQNINVLS